MTISKGRTLLLQTASILVLSTGIAFAQANDESVPDTEEGMVVNPSDAERAEPAAGAEAEADVEANTALETQANPNDESVPDVEEGMVTTPDDPVDVGAMDLGNSFEGWVLADFHGARVFDEDGVQVGAVSGVVHDDGDDVYLLVSLTTMQEMGRERVVPLSDFSVDASTKTLVLTGLSASTLEVMPDFATVASGYTEVESDASLHEMISVIDLDISN